jgi:exonuclease-1
MLKIDLLLEHDVKPYLVFDGGPLPMKQGTEAERRQFVPEIRGIFNICFSI